MDSSEMVKLQVLLYMLHEEDSSSVTGLAKSMGCEKYVISRMLSSMEAEGLVDRTNRRHPRLTQKGKELACDYDEKVNVAVDHLLYEGVDVANARHDALIWAIYNSGQTMDVIRQAQVRCQMKYEFRRESGFEGNVLCRNMPDGNYPFPFMIYRGQAKDGNIISMANAGFEHPCTLSVKKGAGRLQLHAIRIQQKSGRTGIMMEGMVNSVKYYSRGSYITASRIGDIIEIPIDAFHFENVGAGIGQILHGTLVLKMTCTVGPLHMPESKAVFTLLI